MVRTLIDQRNWSVVVTAMRPEGSSVIGASNDISPLDAFDYAVQAQGYFRFAIQEMDCRSITIDIRNYGLETVELIEITRD
jgi:hypothetical protein